MADLAGFDVVGEVHIETVIDLINLSPIKKQSDGSNIYLLGGPFSTDLQVPLGALGIVPVSLILDATLHAVVHQPLALLSISLKGGTTGQQGVSLSHLGGTITVTVPLAFAAPVPTTPGAPPASQVPVLLLAAVNPDCVLDDATRSLADSKLGPGGAERLRVGLESAVAEFLALAGVMPVPVLAFRVVPGIDSDDPLQLSAPPLVAWIDATTLAVFGYYRAGASGGDVAAKTISDIGQSREEFFYNQPGVLSVLPARRGALLLSADAFHRVLACPTIRTSVVKGCVFQREYNTWLASTRNLCGPAITRRVSQDKFYAHYIDEANDNPSGDSKTWFDKAMADVQADVEVAILAKAHDRETDWINGADGQNAITDAMPPPCGTGAVEIARKSVDFPLVQGDFVPMLRRLDVRLGVDRVTIDFVVDGTLEISTGDLSARAAGRVEVFVGVTYDGHLAVTYKVDPPSLEIDGTGLDGGIVAVVRELLGSVIEGPWQTLMAYLELVLQAQLTKLLGDLFPTPTLLEVTPPSRAPFPARLDDVRIDPQSIVTIGLIGRQLRWNLFQPALLVNATATPALAKETAIQGRLHLPATQWGCVAAAFDTTRKFWDTTVGVRFQLRDAPHPVTVQGWQVELGNFGANSIANSTWIDPRPTWSNEASRIAAGSLTLSGQVNIPDSPVATIQGPYVLGHLNRRDDVAVSVTGDADDGWELSFRGVDGNFFVHFMLDVTDGDGVSWHGETFQWVHGDKLELPPEYWQYKADCDAKYQQWYLNWWITVGSKYAYLANVQPGQPVMGNLANEAFAIRTLAAAGDTAALTRLVVATEHYGPSFLKQVGGVPNVSRALPWTPASLGTALRGWYRGDALGTDLSAAGNMLTIAGTTPGSGLNRYPTITFNGTSDHADRSTFVMGGTGAFTTALVCKLVSASQLGQYGCFFGLSVDSLHFHNIVQSLEGDNAQYDLTTPAGKSVGAGFKRYITTDDGTTAFLYVDGSTADAGGVASAGHIGSNYAFSLGSRQLGGALFSNIEVAEFLVIEGALGATDRTKLDTYLRSRYGI